jgi:hypothetical protein
MPPLTPAEDSPPGLHDATPGRWRPDCPHSCRGPRRWWSTAAYRPVTIVQHHLAPRLGARRLLCAILSGRSGVRALAGNALSAATMPTRGADPAPSRSLLRGSGLLSRSFHPHFPVPRDLPLGHLDGSFPAHHRLVWLTGRPSGDPRATLRRPSGDPPATLGPASGCGEAYKASAADPHSIGCVSA